MSTDTTFFTNEPNVKQIRIAGRSTQGVSLFKIPEGDKIVYVSRVQDLEK